MRRYRRKTHNLFYFWIAADAVHALPTSLAGGYIRHHVRLPVWCGRSRGSTKTRRCLAVNKGTRAVIEDKEPELDTHNRAVESNTAAVEELNEMGVHVNNAGEFPVFSLGVREPAYDPSPGVAGGPLLDLPEAVELSALTNARGWLVGMPQVTQGV
jgi:hypothetical protein